MKDKNFERESEAFVEQVTQPEPIAAVVRRRFRYIGPDYHRGIELPNGQLIRPLDMSDEAIDGVIDDAPHLFDKV